MKFFKKDKDGLQIICPYCKKSTTALDLQKYDIDANYETDKPFHQNTQDMITPEMNEDNYNAFKEFLKEMKDAKGGSIAKIGKHKVGGLTSKPCFTSENIFKFFLYFFIDNEKKTAGFTFRILDQMLAVIHENREITFVPRADELAREVSELLLRGNFLEIIKRMDAELKESAEDSLATFWKGRALFELEHYEQAIECYDKALERMNSTPDALMGKGIALRRLGRFEEAITCYDKALELDPNDAQTISSKGVALRNLDRNDEALACYDKALELGLNDYQIWTNKGRVLSILDRNPEAIECYNKALDLSPNEENILELKKEAEIKLKN